MGTTEQSTLPYSCTFKGCTMSFNSQSELGEHGHKHHGHVRSCQLVGCRHSGTTCAKEPTIHMPEDTTEMVDSNSNLHCDKEITSSARVQQVMELGKADARRKSNHTKTSSHNTKPDLSSTSIPMLPSSTEEIQSELSVVDIPVVNNYKPLPKDQAPRIFNDLRPEDLLDHVFFRHQRK